jgi:hypothetical protein
MGWFTLNVLLSLALFEREVTANPPVNVCSGLRNDAISFSSTQARRAHYRKGRKLRLCALSRARARSEPRLGWGYGFKSIACSDFLFQIQ